MSNSIPSVDHKFTTLPGNPQIIREQHHKLSFGKNLFVFRYVFGINIWLPWGGLTSGDIYSHAHILFTRLFIGLLRPMTFVITQTRAWSWTKQWRW